MTTLADPENGLPDGLVDLERYPLDAPESPRWVALIDRVKAQLAAEGCATLPGFLSADALERSHLGIAGSAEHVPIRRQLTSPYARTDLESDLDADDPRRAQLEWFAGHVTRDMIPPYAPAHRLYVSALFKQFIAMPASSTTPPTPATPPAPRTCRSTRCTTRADTPSFHRATSTR